MSEVFAFLTLALLNFICSLEATGLSVALPVGT